MTPLQESNAAHERRAFSGSPASTGDPWSADVRTRLATMRRNAIDRGEWTGPRFSLPEPCWLVEAAHSTTQQKVYLALKEIGKGKIHRPKTGATAEIRGGPNASGRPDDWDAWAALRAVAWVAAYIAGDREPLRLSTCQDAIRQLVAKHSIGRTTPRIAGDKTPANRLPTYFRVYDWAAVLAERAADPAIATTHRRPDKPNGVHWTNGRANSRRLLTPGQAEAWNFAALPAQPKKATTEAQSAHPAPVAAPAESTIKDNPPVVNDRRRRPGLPEVPPDQQEALNALCGCLDTPPDENGKRRPIFCDLAPEILANAIACAAEHGKVFRPEWLGELCERIFEKTRRQTQYGNWKIWFWRVEQPSAWMRKCALDQAFTCKLIDDKVHLEQTHERKAAAKAEKDRREWWEIIAKCLQDLRSAPTDEGVLRWRDGLLTDHEELFIEVWREDDKRHGGDGEGSSWNQTPLSLKGARGP